MGNACCDAQGNDNRPFLKVTVMNATGLSKMHKKKDENEVYVELKFGPLKGNRNDVTKKTRVVKTSSLNATWNEDVYLPIPTFPLSYSLQLSIFDKDNPVLKEYVGKSTILYYEHGENFIDDRMSTEELDRIAQENNANILKTKFLPGRMYQEHSYTMQLEKLKNHGFRAETGILKVKCQFVEQMDPTVADEEQSRLLKKDE